MNAHSAAKSPFPLRLAMWSGPRNISTALMRSWENRGDTFVVDEPFYAHYLHATQKPHPVRDEIIAHGETDWKKVAQQLTGPIPQGKAIYYQKQMTHHLLPQMGRDWLAQLTHVFLLRHPQDVITSYLKIVDRPTPPDTGFPQQTEIFHYVKEHLGVTPLVIETVDVLENPRKILGMLCEKLGIDFRESMLSWPAGKRATDGVWAPHWYGEVEKSTGFRPYKPKNEQVPEDLLPLYEECLAHYEALYPLRLH